MAIDYVQIGRNVKHYRLQKELKQIQLAEKVHVTEQHISHIECGRTKLSLPLLVSLSEAWALDNIVYSISGQITEDEILEMINSID